MAWPPRNNHMGYLSLPQQYESSNKDHTFDEGTSATETPIATATMPLSTEYILCDPLVQHASTLLDPNFTLPPTIGPLSPEYMDHGTMQGLLAKWNSTNKDQAADYHCLVENTVRVPSSGSTSSMHQPTTSNANHIRATRGKLTHGRRANKQEDHQGSFECHWIDCNHRGAFSGESVLMRHIKTQHVNPRSIDCPSCGKSFNRKDNMMEHLGRAHREYI